MYPHALRPLLASILAAVSCTVASAQGWVPGPFVRPASAEPIITPKPEARFLDPILGKSVAWEPEHTFNPAAVVRQGKVYLLYRAEDNSGASIIGGHTSRLGLASSTDGLHFTQEPEPVFYPDKDAQQSREWPGGVEDPRIVESEDGTYFVTYTQWNQTTYSIGIASSRDLRHWTKYGPVFANDPGFAPGGKYAGLKYKSGGILTWIKGGRLLAARVQGQYWMYWGEGEIHLATSADLVHWRPVEDGPSQLKVMLRPRPGLFDSGLPEVGPPPVLTLHGIMLLYNGKNADGANGSNAADAAPGLAPGAYSVGAVRFAATNPKQLLDRTTEPFFKPELPWEKSGQYAAGTTFAEGLVFFEGRWFLYYGCADSRVGVATCGKHGAPSSPGACGLQ